MNYSNKVFSIILLSIACVSCGKNNKQTNNTNNTQIVEPGDDLLIHFFEMGETYSDSFLIKYNNFEILVDGGKGQLSAVYSVISELGLTSKILLAGMFKNRKHKTAGLVLLDGTEIFLDKDNLTDDELLLLRFLTAVQNEVHRFAVTYQRKLATKRNLKYRLEEILGIGPAKRKKLLATFGTIKAISEATLEQLQECPTITSENAQSVFEHFHGKSEE